MKKKVIFLFLLCLLILPISNVYASKRCNGSAGTLTTSVSDNISDISYRIYPYHKNIDYYNSLNDYCGFENAVANNNPESECDKIPDTKGREVCFYQKICVEYGKSPYYDSSGFCKTHGDGSTPYTKSDLNEMYSAMRDQVCAATFLDYYGQQNTAYFEQVKVCKKALVDAGCTDETTCKKIACKSSAKKDGYCAGTSSAEDVIDNYEETTGTTDDDLGLTDRYTGGTGGTTGTIADDLKNIDDLTPENCYGFGDVVYYATLIVKLIQISAPIILIIWASIDLFKSVIGGDEKKILEMRKPILHRFIAAACIFLVPWIVDTVVSSFTSDQSWLTCWKNNRFSYKYTKPAEETDEEENPSDTVDNTTTENN